MTLGARPATIEESGAPACRETRRITEEADILSRSIVARILALWVLALGLCVGGRAWGAAPTFTVGPVPGWVDPVDPDLTTPPGVSESRGGIENLLFHRDVRVGDHQVERFLHVAKRIVSEPGLSATSQFSVEFDATYEALVIHYVIVRREGVKQNRLDPRAIKLAQRQQNLEQQMYDSDVSTVLFLDDLRVGDVVEYAYTLRGADPTLGEKHVDAVFLAMPEYVAHLRTRVSMPRGRELRGKFLGPDIAPAEREPQVRQTASGTEYVWDRREVAAAALDSNTPSWYHPLPWVQMTEYSSWGEVAVWAAHLFEPTAQSSERLRAAARAWLQEATTPQQFVIRALRFVQDEVRYVGIEVGLARRRPSEPGLVFDRRHGDCKDKSALLVAILRAVGLKASPALVSSSRDPKLSERAPSPNVFDHVIVRLQLDKDRTYWLDATASQQGGPLERYQFSEFEWALVVDRETTGLDPLVAPPVGDMSPLVKETFRVPPAGSQGGADLDVEQTYRGASADGMRSYLKASSREQQSKFSLEKYREVFADIRERAPLEVADDREENRVSLVAHYTVPKIWNKPEGEERWVIDFFPPLMAGILTRPSAMRKLPWAMPYPLNARCRTTFHLADEFGETTDQTDVERPEFHYHLDARLARHQLTYTFDVKVDSAFVAPDQLASFGESIDRARGSLNRNLIFTRPLEGPNWYAWGAVALAAPLIGWGARKAYLFAPAQRAPVEQQEASALYGSNHPEQWRGIKGWLVFLALRVLGAPFLVLAGLMNFGWIFQRKGWTNLTGSASARHVVLAYSCLGELIVLLALFVYSCIVMIHFFGKRRAFPYHLLWFTLALMAQSVADAVILAFTETTSDLSVPRLVSRSVGNLLILWCVFHSKRVKATFVE